MKTPNEYCWKKGSGIVVPFANEDIRCRGPILQVFNHLHHEKTPILYINERRRSGMSFSFSTICLYDSRELSFILSVYCA